MLRIAEWGFSCAAKQLHFVEQLQLCAQSYSPPLLDDTEQDTSVPSTHFPSVLYLERKQPGHRDCSTQHPSVVGSTVGMQRSMTQGQIVTIHFSSILTYFIFLPHFRWIKLF